MSNRLARETSPYLQQHADNPVDWHAWGDEALNLARANNKPILLSVGYSACHWCHVMAHESFEDAAVAALMNELFVNIKVDREERPDLDQIYQTAHAMLTQRSGGWPLTMFLLPDQTPFFGGTYFPKTARHGMPGFIDLLPQIAAAFRNQQTEIARQSESLAAALARTLPPPATAAALSSAPLDTALRELKDNFDEVEGGLGNAPKFPHPAELELCLRGGVVQDDDYAHQMVKLTLTKMAEGGIYDQVGGGFCRYSVDQTWTIPHFEKMLYDNGPLLRLLSDLWLLDAQPLYRRTVADTAAWVMREMQSPVNAGGYYSSLDADSEHEEGKYYVWTPEEVRQTLTPDEYALIAPHYGLDARANFEHEFWHLRVTKPLAAGAGNLALLDAARAKLFARREQRVRPGRDEKILVSWNALMIKGMARAARAFGETAWLASARRAADFLHASLWRDGRLLATYKDGHAHLNAYLDDYAFLLDALIELMQHDLRAEDVAWAREIADVLIAQFEDRDNGGFYFVSHDHERLIHRAKTGHDNATPSGNGIAAFALNRLGHLLGEPRWCAAAERALKAFKPMMERQASAHSSLCMALDELLDPPAVVVLTGDAAGEWQRKLAARYLPQALIVRVPPHAEGLPAMLDKPAPQHGVNAWVCRGVECLPAISDFEHLMSTLANARV